MQTMHRLQHNDTLEPSKKSKTSSMIGKTFGRWTVIEFGVTLPDRHYAWVCRCSCGTTKIVNGSTLRSGASLSCGCLKGGIATHGHARKKASSTYRTWASMKARCTNTNKKDAKNYILRGITIDPTWMDFAKFLEDMGEKPLGLELNRIDNEKGYSKANCQWTTHKNNTINYKRGDKSFIFMG